MKTILQEEDLFAEIYSCGISCYLVKSNKSKFYLKNR